MEGDRKRRASWVSNSPPYDVEEEEMEKFFALIKSIRATKESMIKEANESKAKKQKEERTAVWTPTVECEDFMPEMKNKSPVIFSIPSNDRKGSEKNTGLDTLDLNLPLSI
ncbi:hypothetical protein MRB53_018347 [Persea americana]|uniref:Uncharacterized protein n=1 Tax=Persea americana TaxID=3435 RepID=A0ACC2M862_PERAE|nr:hypothetical protein MRB53_018347 [Persea americana]|eukprot:TRINITY_DN6576_c0_g1_i1.p1 TRINITY_DN6576_c0_g1~~TRINITY_DN6576_c0_g1_i1.p1  ORF type:complete len:111 (-),score=31.21 TRINITY_DN6576_c0_g1_i1:185-517(-)